MIRVLLVDDHPVVRSGYRRLLDQAGDVCVVAEAGDGESAYAMFANAMQPPDVIVTDLTMPGGGGLELIRKVLLRAPDARVLVFSMHDGDMVVRRALKAGARGYLTKAASPDCLVVAIRALHAGERYLGPDLPSALLTPQAPRHEAERLSSLSAREFEIFRMLAEGHSSAECAEALHISPKTVANHQTLIKEKLGVVTSAALAHLAICHQIICI
ncbi:response regulator transcription factor [soil metagenome]